LGGLPLHFEKKIKRGVRVASKVKAAPVMARLFAVALADSRLTIEPAPVLRIYPHSMPDPPITKF
jgi:hypothetical protein